MRLAQRALGARLHLRAQPPTSEAPRWSARRAWKPRELRSNYPLWGVENDRLKIEIQRAPPFLDKETPVVHWMKQPIVLGLLVVLAVAIAAAGGGISWDAVSILR
jgi:hypothetical protein